MEPLNGKSCLTVLINYPPYVTIECMLKQTIFDPKLLLFFFVLLNTRITEIEFTFGTTSSTTILPCIV